MIAREASRPEAPSRAERSNLTFRDLSSDQAIAKAQRRLFNLQQELYEEGARNFLFIDVPPMTRSPACEPILPLFVRRWC